MEPLRVAIIGCGKIAKVHVRPLLAHRDVSIVGLVDADPRSILTLRSLFPDLADVPDFSTPDALYENVALDAVQIFTPHTMHAAHVMAALERELHVLVEKPMVTRPEDGEAIVAKAAEVNRVVLVSYQRHYQPAYLYIKDAIERGVIGRVKMVAAVQGQNWRHGTVGTWRQDESLSGGGMLMDTGSHLVDVITWLVNRPVEWVVAHIENDGAPVDVNSSLSVGFADGARADMTLIGDMPYISSHVFEDVTVSGTAGVILYRNGRVYTLGSEGFMEPISLPPPSSADLNWIGAIRGREANASPPIIGLRVSQLTAAARESAASGSVIQIAETQVNPWKAQAEATAE